MYHHILRICHPKGWVNAKPLLAQWFFLCGLMNLILDLLGSLDEGKMQNQCFQSFSRNLVK
jgi:hypothetical protein